MHGETCGFSHTTQGILMDVVAKALILAVHYIADGKKEGTSDDDVAMLERISALLKDATNTERNSLLIAAEELNFPEWSSQIGLV